MSSDLTDALRRIIEPIKETLVSTAQRHHLDQLREELSIIHGATERAFQHLNALVPVDMNDGPPADEPSGGITRSTPQPGQIWVFSGGNRFDHEVTGQVESPSPGQPVELAMVVEGRLTGSYFKFNASDDPTPLNMVGQGRVFDPEPEPGSARERMLDGTDNV